MGTRTRIPRTLAKRVAGTGAGCGPQLQSPGRPQRVRGPATTAGGGLDDLFASIQFFIFLRIKIAKLQLFLTAVLTRPRGRMAGSFIIHLTKMLEPNSATKEKDLFSPEAILIATELRREMLAREAQGRCTPAPCL